jgi:hypothetical protein
MKEINYLIIIYKCTIIVRSMLSVFMINKKLTELVFKPVDCLTLSHMAHFVLFVTWPLARGSVGPPYEEDILLMEDYSDDVIGSSQPPVI